MVMYSVSYVKDLEQQVADLQGNRDQQTFASTSRDHLESCNPSLRTAQMNVFQDVQGVLEPMNLAYLPSVSSLGDVAVDFDFLHADENLFSISQPPPIQRTPVTSTTEGASQPGGAAQTLNRSVAVTMAGISINEGASFFQTYFEILHPRYPFLDVEECSGAYLKWKTSEIASCDDKGWSTSLLNLIFANGAILQQAWLDHPTRRQHQEIMLKAHAEQSIITDSSLRPLSQIQAMLLYAFHALHGESTSRVVHIVGVAMRFAILHRFHAIRHDGSEETDMKIKAWWCIYSLDKVVAITLHIPPYPPDEWIESPFYENKPEPQFFMPWASDVLGASEAAIYNFDLRFFLHMCKIRQIHSEILANMRRIAPGSILQCLQEMRAEIDRWAKTDEVFANGHLNGQGHRSPLGMVYVAHMTRVVLYSSVPFETTSEITDELLQACCDSCATFRALQKRRQIPKHWFDMLFLFQVGVTMLYIIWRRAIPISKAVDRAIRDCTVILSIFADRSQHADVYRDCMDVLASSISRASPPGNIDTESRQELASLVCQIEENGLAPHTFTKLSEMCKNDIITADGRGE